MKNLITISWVLILLTFCVRDTVLTHQWDTKVESATHYETSPARIHNFIVLNYTSYSCAKVVSYNKLYNPSILCKYFLNGNPSSPHEIAKYIMTVEFVQFIYSPIIVFNEDKLEVIGPQEWFRWLEDHRANLKSQK